ncbi:AAA family ATPase (plasmid) [Haloimpatiens sp. FM7330]|uniref:AAA family ATPase n=1 Tax=Haloimpatiens sp. FM7330 TaxID=3298610 RepID=UPI003645787B
MKISSIKINGYKNLIDCTYNLSQFNVLIGANNSGKSNFLEVFSFLDTILTGSDDVKDQLFRLGVSPRGNIQTNCTNVKNKNISVEIEFLDEVDKERYKYIYFIEVKVGNLLSGNKGLIEREYLQYKSVNKTGPINTVFDRRNTDVKLKSSKIASIDAAEALLSIIYKIKDVKENMDIPVQKGIEDIFIIAKTPVIYCSPNQIREAIVKQKPIIKNGRIASIDLINEIEKIFNSDQRQYFEEVLQDTLGIKIEIYNLKGIYKNLFVNFYDEDLQNKKNTIDKNEMFENGVGISTMSDGTLIVLNILTYLVSNKYPVLSIEELENSIHPKLLKKIIRLIQNDFSDIQVIITTHSPVLLNMVNFDNVSLITNKNYGKARIENVKDRKDLMKKLSGPFSDFSDIFYLVED